MEPALESHGFITLLTMPWFLAVVGGTVALGVAILYGILSTRRRTERERARTEAATREIYHKDNHGEGV